MTDQGMEFFNKHFQALMSSEEIHLYNTFNETKASIVERLIHTLKTKMWRYFMVKRTLRYIDMSDLIFADNYSIHRSIKTKPALVNHENEDRIWHVLYDDDIVDLCPVNYKFKINDQVRISKIKWKFEKEYLLKFSREIFTVRQYHGDRLYTRSKIMMEKNSMEHFMRRSCRRALSITILIQK